MRAYAVVENGKPLQEIELPTPEPTGTEVLLEVTHCGVCHSDLHIWEGYYDIGGGQKMSLVLILFVMAALNLFAGYSLVVDLQAGDMVRAGSAAVFVVIWSVWGYGIVRQLGIFDAR